MARSPLLFATDNATDPTGFHLTQAAFQNVPSMPRVLKSTIAGCFSAPGEQFARSLNLVVDDLSGFDEGLFGSSERRRRCQPEPVFIVDRHNEADLAREIETVEMVSLGLQDHSLGSHAALNRRPA